MKTIHARTFNEAIKVVKRLNIFSGCDISLYREYDLSTSAVIKDDNGMVKGYIYMNPYYLNTFSVTKMDEYCKECK